MVHRENDEQFGSIRAVIPGERVVVEFCTGLGHAQLALLLVSARLFSQERAECNRGGVRGPATKCDRFALLCRTQGAKDIFSRYTHCAVDVLRAAKPLSCPNRHVAQAAMSTGVNLSQVVW